MKITDLRIGNIIRHNVKEDGTDQFIEPNEDAISEDDMWNLVGQGLDGAEPIPLTEEWLKKFGFHEKYKSVSNHWTKKAELINAGCELIDPEDEATDKLKGVFYYANWGIDILYVHQLQNLYFALTGEELTLPK